MQNSLIIYAVDDGYFPHYFKRGKGSTLLVLTSHLLLANNQLVPLDLRIGKILVDYDNVTKKIIHMVNNAKQYKRSGNLRQVLLLDGITYAGFNVANPIEIYIHTKVPVLTVFYQSLDLKKIYKALVKHFSDWQNRFTLIDKVYIEAKGISTKKGYIKIHAVGIDLATARTIIESTQVFSRIPEPLRISHIIASSLAKILIKYGLLKHE